MDSGSAINDWPRPRARIGLIIPSVNTLTEPQFNRYAPPGVEIHVTRVRIDIPFVEQLPKVLEAAALLADARCDVIVYHCTGKSMEAGLAAERRMVAAIGEATGVPSASTATAILEALRVLGARRLVLTSPYTQQTNDKERAFLAEAGITVLHDRAMDLPVPDGMCGAPPDYWVRVTEEAADPSADGYFVSCTNIQAIEAIPELEQRLGKPVITSNQATLWYCLRTCGMDQDVPQLGRLFRLGLPEVAAVR